MDARIPPALSSQRVQNAENVLRRLHVSVPKVSEINHRSGRFLLSQVFLPPCERETDPRMWVFVEPFSYVT